MFFARCWGARVFDIAPGFTRFSNGDIEFQVGPHQGGQVDRLGKVSLQQASQRTLGLQHLGGRAQPIATADLPAAQAEAAESAKTTHSGSSVVRCYDVTYDAHQDPSWQFPKSG